MIRKVRTITRSHRPLGSTKEEHVTATEWESGEGWTISLEGSTNVVFDLHSDNLRLINLLTIELHMETS